MNGEKSSINIRRNREQEQESKRARLKEEKSNIKSNKVFQLKLTHLVSLQSFLFQNQKKKSIICGKFAVDSMEVMKRGRERAREEIRWGDQKEINMKEIFHHKQEFYV